MRKYYRLRRLRFFLAITLTIIAIYSIFTRMYNILIENNNENTYPTLSNVRNTKSIQINTTKQSISSTTPKPCYFYRKRTARLHSKIVFPNKMINEVHISVYFFACINLLALHYCTRLQFSTLYIVKCKKWKCLSLIINRSFESNCFKNCCCKF
jgi:hypothetical protein